MDEDEILIEYKDKVFILLNSMENWQAPITADSHEPTIPQSETENVTEHQLDAEATGSTTEHHEYQPSKDSASVTGKDREILFSMFEYLDKCITKKTITMSIVHRMYFKIHYSC